MVCTWARARAGGTTVGAGNDYRQAFANNLHSPRTEADFLKLGPNHLHPHVHAASPLPHVPPVTCACVDPAPHQPGLLRRRGPSCDMAQVQRQFAASEAPKGHVLTMACRAPVVR